MSTILLCNRDLNSATIQQTCNLDLQKFSAPHCPNPKSVRANTPYLLNGHSDPQGRRMQALIAPAHIARPITDLTLTFGEDNILALAAMMEQLKDYNVAMTGASTSVYGERINGFADSVKRYQRALLAYRDAKIAKAASQTQLKQQAHTAFLQMQRQFNAELNAVTSHIRSRRGTPLTSAERGTNIASSSRNATKLQLSSEIEAHKLVKFSQYTKLLGNGLAVIDFGSRIGKIHNTYQANGNWEKELFVESSSFAASAITGIATAKLGATALGIMMAATPVGWVGLIIGGAVVVAASASASIAMNNAFHESSSSWFDEIMKALD